MVTSKITRRGRGRPTLPNPAERKRDAVRRYQVRQRERRAQMERVAIAAEALNQILISERVRTFSFPRSLVDADPAVTLQNIAQYVAVVASPSPARATKHALKEHLLTKGQSSDN